MFPNSVIRFLAISLVTSPLLVSAAPISLDNPSPSCSTDSSSFDDDSLSKPSFDDSMYDNNDFSNSDSDLSSAPYNSKGSSTVGNAIPYHSYHYSEIYSGGSYETANKFATEFTFSPNPTNLVNFHSGEVDESSLDTYNNEDALFEDASVTNYDEYGYTISEDSYPSTLAVSSSNNNNIVKRSPESTSDSFVNAAVTSYALESKKTSDDDDDDNDDDDDDDDDDDESSTTTKTKTSSNSSKKSTITKTKSSTKTSAKSSTKKSTKTSSSDDDGSSSNSLSSSYSTSTKYSSSSDDSDDDFSSTASSSESSSSNASTSDDDSDFGSNDESSGTKSSYGSSSTNVSSSDSSSSVSSSSGSSSSSSSDSAFGYASLNGGTTGGKGGSEVTATSLDELTSYAAQDGNLIITVSGSFSGTDTIKVSSDKTIIGASGASLEGVGFVVKGVSNVIIRNLAISKVVGADAVGVQKSTNVWLDHLELSSDMNNGKDYYDGLIDITHACDYVTVSNCYFHDHYKVTLVGHSDSNGDEDTGHLTVTYAYNYFDNVNSRGPSLRFGTGHMYNNYYNDMTDCINIRDGATALVENNVFSGVTDALYSVDGTGSAQSSGNDFGDGSSDIDTASVSMSYTYSLKDTTEVVAYVQSNAGATL